MGSEVDVDLVIRQNYLVALVDVVGDDTLGILLVREREGKIVSERVGRVGSERGADQDDVLALDHQVGRRLQFTLSLAQLGHYVHVVEGAPDFVDVREAWRRQDDVLVTARSPRWSLSNPATPVSNFRSMRSSVITYSR